MASLMAPCLTGCTPILHSSGPVNCTNGTDSKGGLDFICDVGYVLSRGTPDVCVRMLQMPFWANCDVRRANNQLAMPGPCNLVNVQANVTATACQNFSGSSCTLSCPVNFVAQGVPNVTCAPASNQAGFAPRMDQYATQVWTSAILDLIGPDRTHGACGSFLKLPLGRERTPSKSIVMRLRRGRWSVYRGRQPLYARLGSCMATFDFDVAS
jgi:hypothetical protein